MLTLMFCIFFGGVTAGYAEKQALDGLEDFYEDPQDTDQSFPDFEDTAADIPPPVDTQMKIEKQPDCCLKLPFNVNGNISMATAFNYAHSAPQADETDWRGLSKFKPELNLEVSRTVSGRFRYFLSGMVSNDLIYGLRGRDNYTDEVIDEYEVETTLEKAYVQVELYDALDLKTGRQIVVWGKSDMIRVVDILNPLSIREPGLTDIEDLRMPLFMNRLDYYMKRWHFSSIFIHEIRFDELPVWGSDFYPASSPLPYETKPDSTFANTEYAFSISKTIQNLDFAFYYADVLNDAFYIEAVSEASPPVYDPHLAHARITMIGADANLAVGSWLLKSEIALFQDIVYYNPADHVGPRIIKGRNRYYDRYDALVGFEYMGFDDTVINIDAVIRRIRNYDAFLETVPMGPDQTETQWAVRTSRTFINETLKLELLASVYEWDGGGGAFERFTIEYDWTDAIKTRGGVIIYQSGSQAGFQNIGSNDRLFFTFEYSFQSGSS